MTRDQRFLRIGALCVIVGSVAVFVFRAAHGDLPTGTPEAALRFVASHPNYRGVHLGANLGVLVWVGGLVALASALTQPVAWFLGRLGVASALVGAAIYIVDFTIDGFGLNLLADTWVATSPAGQADAERIVEVAFVVLWGTSLISISILWGVTLVLFGLAVAREGYPSWLGWTGLVVGTATFAALTTQLLQPGLVPGLLVYAALPSAAQLWSLALGIAMWRRAAAASGTTTTARHADGGALRSAELAQREAIRR